MKTREEYKKIYRMQKLETVAAIVITLVAAAAVALTAVVIIERIIDRRVAAELEAYIVIEPEYIAPAEDATGADYASVDVLSTETPKQIMQAIADPVPVEQIAQPERYALTEAERSIVEAVVMAESGGESYEGQMAVAQCILNACEKEGIRPDIAVVGYGYTPRRVDPSESVCEAVAAVFDNGETVTDEKILYFYAPALVYSAWHESQSFVLEIGGHRFFAENGGEIKC